jgi:hypothetical protein
MQQIADANASDPNAISSSIIQELSQDGRLRQLMLLREAIARVKQRLREPKRWEAFWAVKAEGRSPTEIADELKPRHRPLEKMKRPEAWVSVAAGDLEKMLRKELEERLNRLLTSARKLDPSDELAHFAGRTVDQLRQAGERLMGPLQAELEKLLDGLMKVATEGKSASDTAQDIGMSLLACTQAANLLGADVKDELSELESQEASLPMS